MTQCASPKKLSLGKLSGPEVAKLLVEYGRRVSLAGGNPYRAKAYIRAAENLAAQTEPLDRLIKEDRLRQIPGVGAAIADIITQLAQTGSHSSLDKMRSEIPPEALELLSIPGLRPEKVLKLYKELGVKSVEELELAAREDRIKRVKGLGAALQQKILQGLAVYRDTQGARHVHRAEVMIAAAAESLKRSNPLVQKVAPAGDFRRGNELVVKHVVVALVNDLKAAREHTAGDVTVVFTDEKRFGITLLLATGSESHLHELEALATTKGYQLTAEGLRKGRKLIASRTEAEIYEALGLQYIEPELREGRREIKQASAKKRLPRLVDQKDLRGILHAHTDASDGATTVKEMAGAVRERGFQYFGVSDHSQTAHYAGGLSVEEIDAQHAEIDRLNKRPTREFRIFKGIESDILPDGSLDYPEDVLRRFDFIVASVHGQFRLDKAAQTERILSAVRNPYVTILGHMTGRQLLRRPGYEVDVEKILEACANHGVAVEINSNPWRLDLDWRWYQQGLKLGCLFSINPDAHSISEIDLVARATPQRIKTTGNRRRYADERNGLGTKAPGFILCRPANNCLRLIVRGDSTGLAAKKLPRVLPRVTSFA